MKRMAILLLASLFFASVSEARCFPESEMIHPMSTLDSGITQEQFNAELDLLAKVYGPVVEAKGYHLKINRLWSDDTINSDTDIEGHDWVINSYGGLARYPGMTAEGYLAVACHELGHHMGGAPVYSDNDWAAVEGEADYWATLICMKRLDPKHAVAAAQVLANTLASLEGAPSPTISHWDRRVVSVTYEEHPNAQCRFDTYLAGLRCPIHTGQMSQTNPKINSCYSYPTKTTYAPGSRPRCWFAPAKKEDGSDDLDDSSDI